MINLQQQKEEFKTHLLALGFTSEQILDVARVLDCVRKEPGFHLWRFNAPLRAIALRLAKMGVLRRAGKDNCDLYPAWRSM